jgi:hypothetical protein
MHIDRLYRAGQLTTETRPAVPGVFYIRLIIVIHHDDIAGANHFTDRATHTGLFINATDHIHASF